MAKVNCDLVEKYNAYCSFSFIDDQLLVSQEASEGCDLDRARMCLNSYTVNTLMAPTLTQEGKNWVCQK